MKPSMASLCSRFAAAAPVVFGASAVAGAHNRPCHLTRENAEVIHGAQKATFDFLKYDSGIPGCVRCKQRAASAARNVNYAVPGVFISSDNVDDTGVLVSLIDPFEQVGNARAALSIITRPGQQL